MTETEKLSASIATKKAKLDALRPVSQESLRALQRSYDVDLTYTSNAIEGNTLTLRETAELIEHGITVGGKPLRDHLEAGDHYNAVQWMREVATSPAPLSEDTVCELHRRIVARSQPEIAGNYANHARRIAGSQVILPNPAKIPALMQDFGAKLAEARAEPVASFDAHFQLAAIHPFSDGNGRTARLLMNMMLIRGGYPPVAVRPDDRKTYLDTLETASLTGNMKPFHNFMSQRLETTLSDYLSLLEAAQTPSGRPTRRPFPKP
jgi:Fic family protein